MAKKSGFARRQVGRDGGSKKVARAPAADLATLGEEQILRVRRLCSTLPGSMEKLSHGEPTFFVAKKVFAMFANNHHNDGHVAVYIPVEPGYQATLLKALFMFHCRPTLGSQSGMAPCGVTV